MRRKGGRLRVGDWVEVRAKDEILRTLDQNGEYEGMPFMPEMLAYCGRQFQVYKRAHKTCDTVFPIRGRRVPNAVHLETRCDGGGHGGCEALCLIFWKEAWLKPLRARHANETPQRGGVSETGAEGSGGIRESELRTCARRCGANGDEDVYSCQATRLPYATTRLSWWDMRQYFEDYASGNASLRCILRGSTYALYSSVVNAGVGLGRPLRWVYNRLRPLWRGSLYPGMVGRIPMGHKTPTESLNLQPGELVRVKSHEEILATIDVSGRNRGLRWDAELVPYCGGTYRVLRRVARIIDEKTGLVQEMKNPCIVLDSVICTGRYSKRRKYCPRSIYPYWREIWLTRVPECSLTPDAQGRESPTL
jgi:hypothetical protein